MISNYTSIPTSLVNPFLNTWLHENMVMATDDSTFLKTNNKESATSNMNGTDSTFEEQEVVDNGGQMVAGMALILLSIVTAAGNSLVIHAIRTEKRLQTVSNLFLMSLAVADLTIGVIVMPITAAYTLSGEWRWGRRICKFWLATDYTASTASIFNLVVLTLDRYWSVMAPLRYLRKRTRRRAGLLLAIAWLAASLWLIPVLAWKHLTLGEGSVHKPSLCETDFAHNIVFKLVTSALNFYLPSSLIVILYFRIFRTIKQRTSTFPSTRQHQTLGPMTSTSSEEQNERAKIKNYTEARGKQKASPKNGDISVETQMYKALTIIGPGEQENIASCYEDITVQVEYLTDKSYHLNHRACYPPDPRFHSNLSVHSSSRETGCENKKHLQPSRNLRRNFTSNITKQNRNCNPASLNTNGATTCRKSVNLNLIKERKAARQLGVIMGAFLACWVPYFTIFPVIAFCSSCVPQSAHMATISLGYLNSALNPIIYPLCNHNFRRAFMRMLKCKSSNLLEQNKSYAMPPPTH